MNTEFSLSILKRLDQGLFVDNLSASSIHNAGPFFKSTNPFLADQAGGLFVQRTMHAEDIGGFEELDRILDIFGPFWCILMRITVVIDDSDPRERVHKTEE